LQFRPTTAASRRRERAVSIRAFREKANAEKFRGGGRAILATAAALLADRLADRLLKNKKKKRGVGPAA